MTNVSTVNNIVRANLPPGWMWTTLGQVALDLIGGGTPSREVTEYFGGNIPWFTPTEVPKDRVSVIHCSRENITDLGFSKSSARIIPAGSVMLTSRASIGYVAIAGTNVTTNQGFASIVCPEGLLNSYLAYWLWSIRHELESKATGTTFKEISKAKLRGSFFPLPPLPEQHRIVAKIEELFSKLDAGVAALKKVKAELKRYRQSVLKYAFEGKLTSDFRLRIAEGGLENAAVLLKRIREERKKNEKAKYKDLPPVDTSNLPPLPEGWAWARVGEIAADLIGGGTPSREVAEYFGGDIPWFTPTEVPKDRISVLHNSKENITESGFRNSSARIIPAGSVMLTSRASIGYVGIAGTNVTTNQGFASIVCPEGLFNSYLAYWLWSIRDELESKATGTTFKEISKAKLREFCFPLPPLPEQHQIVSEIDRRFSVANEVEKTVDESLRQAERLRQSILKRAFEGKLVPQDPTDEPASVLLERIRLEKEKAESGERKRKKKIHRVAVNDNARTNKASSTMLC